MAFAETAPVFPPPPPPPQSANTRMHTLHIKKNDLETLKGDIILPVLVRLEVTRGSVSAKATLIFRIYFNLYIFNWVSHRQIQLGLKMGKLVSRKKCSDSNLLFCMFSYI
jgi:hypothetical protein